MQGIGFIQVLNPDWRRVPFQKNPNEISE